MNTDEIRALAKRFREAILRIPRDQLVDTMKDFPTGACGDTSLLFGALLADNGINGFSYIYGYRGNVHEQTSQTHAWLQRGNLIVDLTADQFPDAPPEFIAEEDSVWHRAFRTDVPTSSDFRNVRGANGLAKPYRLIIESMRNSVAT